MKIVLLEDDARLGAVVSDALRRDRHIVHLARTCAEARAAFSEGEFDVALFDIGLPDGSGIDLCRALRSDGRTVPVLLLTARNEIADRVDGLDAGADDYLGKPFALAELLARVRALGRRGPRLEESTRTFGTLVIDRNRHAVTRDGAPLPLTARELDIIVLLAWRDGHVVTRDEILESIWGEASPAHAASFEVLLTRIRRKLACAECPMVIRTVREVGYAWALARSPRA